MRHHVRRLLMTTVAGVIAASVAACASEPQAENPIVIGSKQFTESVLLGQMLVIALEEQDIAVLDRTNFGDTSQNRVSLLAGSIDVYPEYNTTGFTVHLGQTNPTRDGRLLYQQVAARDLEENGVRWVGRSPFNNTYGFASSPETTEQNGWLPYTFNTMAAFLQANPDAQVCVEPEFVERPDGLVLFEEFVGTPVDPAQLRQVANAGEVYTLTRNNTCAFGEVFTTDGRVDGYGLTLVEDPGVMLVYNASFAFRDDTLAQVDRRVVTIAEHILAALDDRTMLRLNFEVDLNNRPPSDVAREYLATLGLAAAR